MNRKIRVLFLAGLIAVAGSATGLYAHCDSMDGPTIRDAQTALAEKNVNYILKWVSGDSEQEIIRIFNTVLNVRELSVEARELADAYLFDTLVRIHRAGEGAPFTGVKPHGTPIDERVMAADLALGSGEFEPLAHLVPAERVPELEERYERAMSLKDFDVNDVEAGREYIEAYVMFFKYAEGEEDGHHEPEDHTEAPDTHGN